MRRSLEFVVFLSVTIALHAAVLLYLPKTGSNANGSGGETLVSLVAVSGDLDAVVADWTASPAAQLETATPDQPDQPDGSDAPVSRAIQPVRPFAAPVAMMEVAQQTSSGMPQLDTAPPAYALPKPKPRPKIGASKKALPRKQQVAVGAGGGAQAGTGRKSAQANLSQGQRASLLSAWGAKIRSRVESRKTYPKGQRGSHSVRLRITVSRNGQLLATKVIESSGINAFEMAALNATTRSGRFPPAPRQLTEKSYSFTLTMRFRR
ncbi:TonB family protein [Thalassovita taeanensis]|uniref:Outer membrane transport energization protein TonB n=1 Tax=Thalassovita taeanensis TaxID=657014 RepID=A0A1H8ZBS7_9RHOB|nr:TonB family protein [Thalassovita taeanensis]SEP61098.1 outer membrane transport energization protein TonB [Thalassovita taeanensis]